MYHPRLYGTHTEIGTHYGEILSKGGFEVSKLPPLGVGNLWAETEAIVRDIYPEIIDEMQALAEACQGSYQRMSDFVFGVGVAQTGPLCTCFAVTRDQTTFFARNHDMFTDLKEICQSALVAPTGWYAFVGHSDALIGFEDGVNEKGLGAGITLVGCQEPQAGINFILALRCVLEKCQTVSEAVALLAEMRFATNQNFILADKSGHKVVVEASPHKIMVREAEQDGAFVAASNNFRLPEMIPFEQVDNRNWYHSLTRYDTVLNALQSGAAQSGLEECQAILAGKRGFACQFDRASQFDTLWSSVTNLNCLEIQVAEGNPSRVKFKADHRLGWWQSKQR